MKRIARAGLPPADAEGSGKPAARNQLKVIGPLTTGISLGNGRSIR
jgi:hypothetical protein